ncbi:MAG: transcriptional repressor LexA [Microbacteriaceae bacterium]|nr:transcriptional repressor LexA [Microbacteriaceae bacterium]
MLKAQNKPPLKPRQLEVFNFIAKHLDERGFPPSMQDIANECNFASLSSVNHQLNQLERLGYIRRESRKSRSLEIVNTPDGAVKRAKKRVLKPVATQIFSSRSSGDTTLVPLVGQIAAGVPITADQQVEDVMPLPQSIVGKGENIFMLKVVGDSMIDAAICEGDYVIIREQKNADNGDIVAAMLDGEATVKIFKQRDGHTWLLPQNSNYEPILGDEAEILGKVTAVLRAVK